MTLGQTVKDARMSKGWTQKQLGKVAGLGQAAISALEHDDLSTRLDARTLIRIAEALDDTSILVHHCETCPIRVHLFEKRFGALKDQRQEVAALVMLLGQEMSTAVKVLEELGRIVTTEEFATSAQEREKARRLFEQISEIERGIGILRFQMVLDDLP